MNFNQLINEIRVLNKDVEIRLGNTKVDKHAFNRIFCSINPEELILPDDYYYDKDHGITKKLTEELYQHIKVESISNVKPGNTLPNLNVYVGFKEHITKDVAIRLQRLNFGVDIKLYDSNLMNSEKNNIYSNVALKKLAIPHTFQVVDDNTIKNSNGDVYKIHNVSFHNLDKFKETGYNLEKEIMLQKIIDENKQKTKEKKFIDQINYSRRKNETK